MFGYRGMAKKKGKTFFSSVVLLNRFDKKNWILHARFEFEGASF